MLRRYDGPTTLQEMVTLGEKLAEARVGMPPVYHNDPGSVLSLLFRASALDIPVMTAADNLVVIGRTWTMRARLMAALVTTRAGHRLIPGELTDTRATHTLEYCDGRPPITAEWTIGMAVNAGLVREGTPWTMYPRDMLYNRALATVIKRGCPEAALGYYMAEAGEAEAIEYDNPDAEDDADARELLSTLATFDGPDGRPQVREGVTIDGLRQAWTRAQATDPWGKRLLDKTAHGGLALAAHISDLVAQLSESHTEEPPNTASDASDDQPAGTGTLPCGCQAEQVASEGRHNDGCVS